MFVIFEGGFGLFLMSGAVEGTGVVRGLIVTRVADNCLGPTGGAHIALALRELTGLQTLDLRSTWLMVIFILLLLCFVVFILLREGVILLRCGGAVERMGVVCEM